MILGLSKNPAGECFRELEDALVALGRPDVCLNAHMAPEHIPPGATVWNFESLGTNGVTTESFQGHELWDFSARNCEAWRAAGRDVKHVPVGYHPSMERFERREGYNGEAVDVVFVGCPNTRRMQILVALQMKDLSVALIPPGIYGAKRDAVLAKASVCVVPLYYPDGVFCSLRAAHLVANKVPMVVETCPEVWTFVKHVPYASLVRSAHYLACECMHMESGEAWQRAEKAYEAFRDHPLRLPC